MDSQSPPDHVQPAKLKFKPVPLEMEGIPEAEGLRSTPRFECCVCKELVPFDEFQSATDPMCLKCRNGEVSRELQDIKARMAKDVSCKLADAASERMPLDHLEHFLAEMMYNFGGMRVFVKAWSDEFKLSLQQHPGYYKNLDQFRSIAKLVLECNKLQHQENVLDLSDEQLRVKKELALMQMLSEAACDPHRKQLLVELMRVNGIELQQIPGLPGYEPMESAHATGSA